MRLRKELLAAGLLTIGLLFGLTCDPTDPGAMFVANLAGSNAFRDISADLGDEGRITGWGGLAVFDYDNDGDIDILVLNGSGTPNRLLRNDGTARFDDVAEEAGLALTDDHCAAGGIGDFNNDGRLDLLIGRQRIDVPAGADVGSLLLINQGPNDDGVVMYRRVEPVESGFDSTAAAMSFGVGDLDNDGLLDIVVGRYDFDAAESLLVPIYASQPNELWRCSGVRDDGVPQFERVTSAGIEGTAQRGWSPETMDDMFVPGTLALLLSDVDGDGRLDLLDCHDIPGGIDYFHNDGDLKFSRRQAEDLNRHGGWMGITGGDYDVDGDIDYFITNVGSDFPTAFLPNTVGNAHNAENGAYYHKLLRNDDGVLVDVTGETVVASSEVLPPWNMKSGRNLERFEFGFGTTWFDVDNRGLLDLYWAGDLMSILTPTLYLNAHGMGRYLRNVGDGTFAEQTAERGLLNIPAGRRVAFGQQEAGRAVAAADLNRDGFQDIVIANGAVFGGPAPQLRILLNPGAANGHWLTIRLVGSQSNRSGIGAQVIVRYDGGERVREVRTTTSAFLGVQPEAHFGLGASATVESVEVRWPSGKTTTIDDVRVDRVLTIEE